MRPIILSLLLVLLAPAPAATAAPMPISSACPVRTNPNDIAFLPNVTKTLGGPDGWVTPFIVQNVGNAATLLQVEFHRFSDGALVICREIGPLAPLRSYADVPNNDADLPDDTQFAVTVRSYGSQIAAVVNEQQGLGDDFEAASYSMPEGIADLTLPNVTRRFNGYDTPVIMQNAYDTPASVRAHFVAFDGVQTADLTLTIPAQASGVIDPDFTPGLRDGTQYTLTIHSDHNLQVVVNANRKVRPFVAYSYSERYATTQAIYVPYVTKAHPTPSGESNTPVVIAADRDSTVTLHFSPIGAGAPQTFTLPTITAGTSMVFDPRFDVGTDHPCTFASSTCLGPGEYSLVIDGSLYARAIAIPTTEASAAAYSGTGITDIEFFFPNVTRELGGPNGFTTPIVLQSADAVAATVQWFRLADGSLAATQRLTLSPGRSEWIDPRLVPGTEPGGQYAVVVNAPSENVAGVVYESSGGGGDSVFMYEGFRRRLFVAPSPQ